MLERLIIDMAMRVFETIESNVLTWRNLNIEAPVQQGLLVVI